MMKPESEYITYQASGFTDRGKVRADNQDNFLLLGNSGACLAAVADGIGGLAGGAEASRLLVDGLETWWYQNEERLLCIDRQCKWIEKSLEVCITELNRQLFEKNEKMGTTLSLLLLDCNQYLIKHAGDSRIYFLRDFGLEQMTHDHTRYEQEREQYPGKLPEPTKMHNVLVNAVGVKPDLFLETAKGDLGNVRAVLLCTDGIYKYFTFDNIEQLLLKQDSSAEKAAYLQQVMQKSTAADNYTAIIFNTRE